jgi:hypothetical protein
MGSLERRALKAFVTSATADQPQADAPRRETGHTQMRMTRVLMGEDERMIALARRRRLTRMGQTGLAMVASCEEVIEVIGAPSAVLLGLPALLEAWQSPGDPLCAAASEAIPGDDARLGHSTPRRTSGTPLGG